MINLVFGSFGGRWCWRVEWQDAKGKLQIKDFAQVDLRPGEAKADAQAFREALTHKAA
jgi:hypothetical protein